MSPPTAPLHPLYPDRLGEASICIQCPSFRNDLYSRYCTGASDRKGLHGHLWHLELEALLGRGGHRQVPTTQRIIRKKPSDTFRLKNYGLRHFVRELALDGNALIATGACALLRDTKEVARPPSR